MKEYFMSGQYKCQTAPSAASARPGRHQRPHATTQCRGVAGSSVLIVVVCVRCLHGRVAAELGCCFDSLFL